MHSLTEVPGVRQASGEYFRREAVEVKHVGTAILAQVRMVFRKVGTNFIKIEDLSMVAHLSLKKQLHIFARGIVADQPGV
jgi:hypothetical protein